MTQTKTTKQKDRRIVSTQFTPEQHDALLRLAAARDQSASAVVRGFVDRGLKALEKRAKVTS
jgi:hypothetical protein